MLGIFILWCGCPTKQIKIPSTFHKIRTWKMCQIFQPYLWVTCIFLWHAYSECKPNHRTSYRRCDKLHEETQSTHQDEEPNSEWSACQWYLDTIESSCEWDFPSCSLLVVCSTSDQALGHAWTVSAWVGGVPGSQAAHGCQMDKKQLYPLVHLPIPSLTPSSQLPNNPPHPS